MVDEVVIKEDVVGQPAEQQTDRPEWLPEKFEKAEDLAKSYNELEKSFSQKQEATQNDLNPFFNEFTEKGELAEESYNKLAAMGLSKEVVDSYIAGQQAQSDLTVSKIQNSVGGADSYNKVVEWASQNLSEAEQNTFNNSIQNGNTDEAIFAIKGIEARYQATQTTTPKTNTPNLIQGQGAAPIDAFRSTSEVVKAINDPRYEIDNAYRKDVEEKIKRSGVM